MNFHEALKALEEGKLVKRKDWKNSFLKMDEWLLRCNIYPTSPEILKSLAELNGHDILAKDWEIYENC